jgi:thioredoxin-like negative regulator of GroEL
VYADYGYEAAPYTAAYPPAETASAAAPPADGNATDFYAQALEAFQQGDYRNATRLAGHASIDDPRNPEVHLLLMQGLFAIGEYRGGAMEAHAVVSLGKTPDWAKLYGLYGAVEPYTEQLRALEKYVRDKPATPEGRFLLGFQYVMAGHPEAAQNEFLRALKLTPKDRLAAQLLKEAGGTVPEDIAKQLSPAPPLPKTFDSPEKGK